MTLPAVAARTPDAIAIDQYLLHTPRLRQAVDVARQDTRTEDGRPTVT